MFASVGWAPIRVALDRALACSAEIAALAWVLLMGVFFFVIGRLPLGCGSPFGVPIDALWGVRLECAHAAARLVRSLASCLSDKR